MTRFSKLDNILVDPKKKTSLKYNNSKNSFETEDHDEFNINNGVANFFKDDGEKLSSIQNEYLRRLKNT